MAGAYPPLILNLSARLDGSVAGAFATFQRAGQQASTRVTADLSRTGHEANEVAVKLRVAAASAQVFQGALGGVASRLTASASLFSTTGGIFAATLSALAGGTALIGAASGVQNYQARLKAASKDQQDFAESYRVVQRVANGSRSSLNDTIAFYTRLKAATEQLGLSQKQLGGIIGTVQKSIQLSGAGAQEAAAAQTQFVQGLSSASGLGGDEFKSLNENAVKVLQNIADGLRLTGAIPAFDGTIPSLRKLGSQGKLTADVLVPALDAIRAKVDSDFEKMPETIEQATTRMKSALTALVVSAENLTGILAKSSGGLVALADNFRTVGGVITVVGAGLAAKFVGPMIAAAAAAVRTGAATLASAGGYSVLQTSLRGTGLLALALAEQEAALIRVMTAGGIAIAEQTAVLEANRIAVGSGARAMPVLSQAMIGARVAAGGFKIALGGIVSFLGGPFGIALTAAAGLVYYLSTQESQAAQAAKEMGISQSDLANAVAAATGRIIAQNDELRKNIDLTTVRGRTEAQETVDKAGVNVSEQRSNLAQQLRTRPLLAGASFADQGKFRQLAREVEAGLPVEILNKRLDELQQISPRAFKVLKGLGYDINSGADALAVSTVRLDYASKAYREAFELAAKPPKAAPAGTTAKDLRLLTIRADAAVTAINASTPPLIAAAARYKAALAHLDDTFVVKGKVDPARADEYEAQRAAIIQGYQGEVNAIKSGAAAARGARAQDRKERRDDLKEANEIARESERLDAFINKDRNQTNRQKAKEQTALLDKLLAEGAAHGKAASPFDADKIALARRSIEDNITKPLRDADAAYAEQLSIQKQILQGDELTAAALQVAYDLIKQGVDLQDINLTKIRSRLVEERRITDQIEKRNQLADVYARAAGNIQGEFTKLFAGGGIGGFAKGISSTLRNAFAEQLSIKIFGDKQKEVSDDLKGANRQNADDIITAVNQVRDAFNTFHGTGPDGLSGQIADGLTSASTAFASNPKLGGAANDNASSGIVPGLAGSARNLLGSVVGLFTGGLASSGKLFKGAAESLSSSAQPGSGRSDPLGSFSENTSKIFTSFGASVDKLLGTGSGDPNNGGGPSAGGGTFASIGAFAGPVGAAIAASEAVNGILNDFGIYPGGKSKVARTGAKYFGIVGGLIASLFAKTPQAFYDLGTDSTGAGKVNQNAYARGDNKKENLSAASSQVSAFNSALAQLANTLGGSVVGGKALGAIGVYKGQYSFDAVSGSGNRVNFATEQEAVAAALRNAIQVGAIEGLREGTKRLLLAAGDFQTQANKASEFESVFTDLKKATDPVGFAVDELNNRFKHLKLIFQEAGASATDYASLQKLYDLQRAEALTTAQTQASNTLKDFLESLTTSPSSGLSARDRQGSALDAFNPFAADISAGKAVDQDKYKAAADTLLSVDREIFGSTQEYFDRLKQITDLTQKAITNIGGTTTGVSSVADALVLNPFAGPGGISTTPITDGLTQLQQALLAQGGTQISLLDEIASRLAGGGGSASLDGYAIDQIAQYAGRNF